MKTPILKRQFPVLFFRGFVSVLCAVSFLLIFGSCDDDKDYSRKEFLIVSESIEKEATQGVYCKIEGGKDTLYVFSNVEYEFFFQTSDKDEEWIKVLSSDYLSDLSATRLILEINPRGDDLLKRTGVLSFSSEENYLGQFVAFNQGFAHRLHDDFTWLKYGTNSPFDTSKETLMKDWSDAQKEYGWQSDIIEGLDNALCYGKNGYLKLGDEFNGANLISPYTNGVITDTVLLLTFNAVAFISEEGIKDNNKLTVDILDGGLFTDGTNTCNIDLNYYDYADRNLASNMWNNTEYRMYIVNTKKSPFTGDTRVQFKTDEDIAVAGRNRIFIDNVTLFIIDRNSYYLADYEPVAP